MSRLRTEEQKARYAANRRAKYAANPTLRESRRRYTENWRRKNPEHARRLADQACEKRLGEAGFTAALKADMIAAQQGLCAICGTDLNALPTKRVHADHCHRSKTPRGVLCQWCNTGLGAFKDDPERLSAAAAYLERHRGSD